MKNSRIALKVFLLAMVAVACTTKTKELSSFDEYPIPAGSINEMTYSPHSTTFTLWAPTAEEVRVMLYATADEPHPSETIKMTPSEIDGTWSVTVDRDLAGKFYTFNAKIKGRWRGDTPGLFAKAVGVNGEKAAIIDMAKTNPAGWSSDRGPSVSPSDIIIYEMHHRDFSADTTSGIQNRGKFLALTEKGTNNGSGQSTGIDHLRELGVTHVHILPSFDFGSIDESKLEQNKYNWGYDPVNYNVPEGSYSTDPANPATRILEFKQMVQALHSAGIGVILDVVYNHTYNASASAFERIAPGYFYRHKADGTLANGSGCGNETASERPMMRKFMIESVLYWMKEYHIDGFRFDLMGIHDIETMNEIRAAAGGVNPNVFIYGEGWAAEAPEYPNDSLAMKANMTKIPGVAAFSDDLRDALRGPFNDDRKAGFLGGVVGNEMSLKFGIVGAVKHPQIAYDSVNYSKAPWAGTPTQMISYVSCHDDMCLVDRLKESIPGITPELLARLDKLAQTVVLTSQGVPFIFAGEEVMRGKSGVHNSYKSDDSVNAIDWTLKSTNNDLFQYYKALITMRKSHPAFRMGDAAKIASHLEFMPVDDDNVVAYTLKNHANGDVWNNIIVVFNGNNASVKVRIPEGKYTIVSRDGRIDLDGGFGGTYGPEILVSAQSAMILHD
jgi:pullulanase